MIERQIDSSYIAAFGSVGRAQMRVAVKVDGREGSPRHCMRYVDEELGVCMLVETSSYRWDQYVHSTHESPGSNETLL